MDWNLRTCARRGHLTYAPAEKSLGGRLQAHTPVGAAWRCLRCGDFVLGPPHGSGPAAEAPLVLRGRALRDVFILRILAVERGIRGLLLLGVAYTIWRFSNTEGSLRRLFENDLPLAKPLADAFGYDLDQSPVVATIRHVFEIQKSTLGWVSLAVLAYAAIQLTEGVGLWLGRRWAEYLTVVATSVFLPLEIYELTERVTPIRIGALVINVAAVIYLIVAKRLFGARGGTAAIEEERRSESLLEVEQASGEPASA
ncbi:MAG TPA: DUF2127 domain-containing protein [Pseudonocardiaceae bacterium]